MTTLEKQIIENIEKIDYARKADIFGEHQIYKLNRRGEVFYYAISGKRRGKQYARKILDKIIIDFPELNQDNFDGDFKPAYDKTINSIYLKLKTGVIQLDKNDVYNLFYTFHNYTFKSKTESVDTVTKVFNRAGETDQTTKLTIIK